MMMEASVLLAPLLIVLGYLFVRYVLEPGDY